MPTPMSNLILLFAGDLLQGTVTSTVFLGMPDLELFNAMGVDAAVMGNHELDFGEALRQELILAIPMRPTCGPECPGPAIANEEDAEVIDERLAGLAQLLDHDQ